MTDLATRWFLHVSSDLQRAPWLEIAQLLTSGSPVAACCRTAWRLLTAVLRDSKLPKRSTAAIALDRWMRGVSQRTTNNKQPPPPQPQQQQQQQQEEQEQEQGLQEQQKHAKTITKTCEYLKYVYYGKLLLSNCFIRPVETTKILGAWDAVLRSATSPCGVAGHPWRLGRQRRRHRPPPGFDPTSSNCKKMKNIEKPKEQHHFIVKKER